MKTADIVSMDLPTSFGAFRLYVWKGPRGREPMALTTRCLDPEKEVMLRLHSECLSGDAFGSLTCDCGPQKELALKRLHEHGNGIFIYHRQEGRNLGLFNKVRAYNLMQNGMDTHEANIALSGEPDGREYSEALSVLEQLLGGKKSNLRVLTNNPYKTLFLERHGYRVTPEALRVGAGIHNEAYTATKAAKFLHNSIGFGPYASFTLLAKDIPVFETLCESILERFDMHEHGRRLFIGVGIPEELYDRESQVAQLKNLHSKIRDLMGAHLVLHISYPKNRASERKLQRFLRALEVPFSLQIRFSETPSVDTDFIDSLHPEYVILQLRSTQLSMLGNAAYASYCAMPYRFVLLDDSGGTGVPIEIESAKQNILTLLNYGVNRIAVAGGISAENASIITELEDYFKLPISVDSESKMRTDDRPDVEKIHAYLARFIAVKK